MILKLEKSWSEIITLLIKRKKVYDSLMWSQGISDTFKIPKAHISLFANLFQKVTKNVLLLTGFVLLHYYYNI